MTKNFQSDERGGGGGLGFDYQEIFDAMPDAVFVHDESGLILDANLLAINRYGYCLEEIKGKHLANLAPPHLFKQTASLIREALKSGEKLELLQRCKDGRELPVEIYSRPIIYQGKQTVLSSLRDITSRKELEVALQVSEERLALALEFGELGVWDLDLVHDTAWRSMKHDRIFGYETQQSKWGMEVALRHVLPEDQVYFSQSFQQAFCSGKLWFECRVVWPDQSLHWICAQGRVLRDEQGQPVRMLGTVEDITERKKSETDLRIAATAFESQEGVMIADASGMILKVNQAFTRITGYAAEEAIGQNPRLLQSGRQTAEFYVQMWDRLSESGIWEGEIWNRRKNGEIYPEHLTITAVKNTAGLITNYVGTLADITMSKTASEAIQQLAFYDALTGLPNRRLLQDRLKHAFAASARSGKYGALLFIDLDNFKTLNDTLGHDIGDLLLRQVAERLTQGIREGDTVSRFGGDEFVVMMEEMGLHEQDAAALTEIKGNKILAALNQPYQLNGHPFQMSCSIGATLFNAHQSSIDELLKQADIAMYQAKSAGRNALCFFDTQMQINITERVALENELSIAIAKQQFQLYYQVQIDSDGRVLGAEALMRWLHPQRGLVCPVQFIPLAEESNLILVMGLWVLESACAQLKVWQGNPLACHLTLAVNVSAKQYRQDDFVEQVKSVVHRHAINPARLKLELTESLLLTNIDETIAKMDALRKLGIQFSLDDFGTGYSSLQYLKRLPVNQLKIDQSFVRDITFDNNDRAIVRTIIAMAQSMSFDVIAEGVETEEQKSLLMSKGCVHYQGYLFGRPVQIEQFMEMLQGLGRAV